MTAFFHFLQDPESPEKVNQAGQERNGDSRPEKGVRRELSGAMDQDARGGAVEHQDRAAADDHAGFQCSQSCRESGPETQGQDNGDEDGRHRRSPYKDKMQELAEQEDDCQKEQRRGLLQAETGKCPACQPGCRTVFHQEIAKADPAAGNEQDIVIDMTGCLFPGKSVHPRQKEQKCPGKAGDCGIDLEKLSGHPEENRQEKDQEDLFLPPVHGTHFFKFLEEKLLSSGNLGTFRRIVLLDQSPGTESQQKRWEKAQLQPFQVTESRKTLPGQEFIDHGIGDGSREDPGRDGGTGGAQGQEQVGRKFSAGTVPEQLDDAQAGREKDGGPGRGGRDQEGQQYIGKDDAQGDPPGRGSDPYEDQEGQPFGETGLQDGSGQNETAQEQEHQRGSKRLKELFKGCKMEQSGQRNHQERCDGKGQRFCQEQDEDENKERQRLLSCRSETGQGKPSYQKGQKEPHRDAAGRRKQREALFQGKMHDGLLYSEGKKYVT